MHNSLHIRDMLRKTNRDPMRLSRRDPHRLLMRDPAAPPADGELALDAGWRVVDYDDPPRRLVAEDLRDCLERLAANGLAPGSAPASAPATVGGEIRLSFAADLAARDCRLTIQPGRIDVEGGGAAGLWAGHAWLEWEMRTRRGPFLPVGSFIHRAAWPVQISQGPWGGNYSVPDFGPEYLSDDSFRLYAHYGVNSMMIYGDLLCYADSAILPELSVPDAEANFTVLAEAARRAAQYGVQFSYTVVGPKLRPDHPVFVNHPNARGTGVDIEGRRLHFLCSSDEEVLDFYRETFGRMFRAAPDLAGLILIVAEESFYNCKMWRLHASVPCPRCAAKTTEQAIADVTGAVAGAVHAIQPSAFVAAWPYTTVQWERPDRVELVRQLPPDVAFWLAIEKDQLHDKGRYVKDVWDYSVDYGGPSDVMRLDAQAAHAIGRDLFVKTETGIGLEVIQFPYVPAMQRLADKWQNVRGLRPAGVHQAWLFFGMFGSRAEELGLWAAYRPDLDRDAFLRRMAARDFGPAAAGTAVEAWRRMSAAVGHLPCICLSTYYIGPSFLGPCHPLIPSASTPIPEVFHGYLYYLQENEETFSHRQIDQARTCLVMDRLPDSARAVGMRWEGEGDGWDIATEEYAAASAEAEAAWRLMAEASARAATTADASRLREETLLTELVYRTFRACENTLRFLQARRVYERDGSATAREEMRRIAALECDNAAGARHIYEEAPWLDLAERTDGTFTPCVKMIDAKIAMLGRMGEES